MKVFLSWSGPLSKRVAEELHRWLPNVIQALEPWLSSEDIAKGSQWSAQIAAELEASKAGIICVTPSNHGAPWLNFEAGAISNQVKPTKMVCTFLVGVKPTDLDGPLAQFQATVPVESDVKRLVVTLNQGLEKAALTDKKLDEAFRNWWPQLESALKSIDSGDLPARKTRTDREIAEETLTIVRQLARRPANQLLSPIFYNEAEQFMTPSSRGYAEWREAASALGGLPAGTVVWAPTKPEHLWKGTSDDESDADQNKGTK